MAENIKTSGFRWIEDNESFGQMKFTFDGEKIFYLFQDYPQELTKEQKEIFDAENPFWADFFREADQEQDEG